MEDDYNVLIDSECISQDFDDIDLYGIKTINYEEPTDLELE